MVTSLLFFVDFHQPALHTELNLRQPRVRHQPKYDLPQVIQVPVPVQLYCQSVQRLRNGHFQPHKVIHLPGLQCYV